MTGFEQWVFEPIDNLSMTAGYGLGLLLYAHYGMRKQYRLGIAEVKQLSVTAPEEYREQGSYAWNPFNVQALLQEMELKKVDKWDLEQKVKRYRIEGDKYGFEFSTPSQKKLWEEAVQKLHAVERNIEAMKTCMNEELLTHKTPDYLVGVLNNDLKRLEASPTKQLESPMTVTPESPHHIEVMKEIASNPNLPTEVAERAERLVRLHDENELERKRQVAIDEALLSIETVEKFYEKNEEEVIK